MGTLGPALALVLACAFFSFQHENFLTLKNFSLILQQVMVVGTIAIGQTLIILTAGIDLSCGMVMALGALSSEAPGIGDVATKVLAAAGEIVRRINPKSTVMKLARFIFSSFFSSFAAQEPCGFAPIVSLL